MGRRMISCDVHVDEYVSVDVDIDDIIESATPEDIKKLVEAIGSDSAPTTCTGVGDPTPARYVEAAYLAAKSMQNLPRPIADLLWHVHGRAI